jgi:asparagine synthetase B (glutamine-hydrolysing)
MRNELFGVFGDREQFERFAHPQRFAVIVEGERATVGIRDLGYGLPGRSDVYEGDDGVCVLWGEAIPETSQSSPRRLLERYAAVGEEAFGELNGSYIAFVEHDGDARVATDMIRSRECFYTDAPGVRVFGSDAARVAGTLTEWTLNRRALLEVTHFGVAFGESTPFEEVERIPFDGYITADGVDEFSRFVYEPREFDYADELAERLERAIERRVGQPGRKGILLSAGYDSRAIVSKHPNLDVGYTLGTPDAAEVKVAKRIASQYETDHVTLEVTDRYLDTRPEVIQYSQGIRESLHIHHRGNNDEIDADTVYHGMLFDTLFRGYFLPDRGIEVLGRTLPLQGLDPDPDVVKHFAKKLGFLSDDSLFENCSLLEAETAAEFARDTIGPHYDACFERADSKYNAMDLLGIKQQPTMPFREHLADHYLESFVAVDRELIEWHLSTPPEHRNTRTFLRALRKLDPEILRHRPPDRPHNSFRLNQIEKFVREKLPGVPAFENPWPDRRQIYDRNNLDRKLFPNWESVYCLPPRVKLRMNDLTTWLELVTGHSQCTPDELLCPPGASERIASPGLADGGR